MNKGTDNSSEYPMSPVSPTHKRESVYDPEDARYGRTGNSFDEELNMGGVGHRHLCMTGKVNADGLHRLRTRLDNPSLQQRLSHKPRDLIQERGRMTALSVKIIT